MIKTDLCIIGAGAAGLSLAAGASQLGASVVIVEHSKMGGDCLNTGCVPSKALLAAAKHHWQSLHSPHFGFNITKATLDFHAVITHVKSTIAQIAPHDSVERFEKLGCKVIQGQGAFRDSTTLKVNQETIKAARFVIATGSSPFTPNIKGLKTIPFYTNETIFDINGLPKHLIIIGGGPIGCELGMAFVMLGAKVTIIARSKILKKDEEDCVDIVRQSMLDKGICLYEEADIDSCAELNHQHVVVINHQSQEKVITGSHILVAAGRTANISELALDEAKVAFDRNGVLVDKRLRSSNKKIFAMGDVIGQHQFTHMANYHAGIILKNCLFRLPAKVKTYFVPWVTYTSPELAHVGLTTKQVEKNSLEVVIIESAYSENDRAQAEGKTKGKIKVISDRKGRVLGVAIVGEQAGELIMPWLLMVQNKYSLRKLTDLIVPYPIFSELNKRVAAKFFHDKLFSAKVRKIVSFIKVR